MQRILTCHNPSLDTFAVFQEKCSDFLEACGEREALSRDYCSEVNQTLWVLLSVMIEAEEVRKKPHCLWRYSLTERSGRCTGQYSLAAAAVDASASPRAYVCGCFQYRLYQYAAKHAGRFDIAVLAINRRTVGRQQIRSPAK